MLTHLSIKNYAIIKSLSIQFGKGLNTVTGETGAGKSIILGGLSLILGNRADTSALLDQTKKCIVEGVFDLTNTKLLQFFAQHEVDFDMLTIVRREILPNGKSRAFINDTPVNLSVLKEFSHCVIDLHSQHQQLHLQHEDFHIGVVDTYSGNADLLTKYATVYINYQNVKKQLLELTAKAEIEKSDADYYQFQFDQLDNAKLQPGEQEEMEEELEMLKHAGEITENISSAYQLMDGDRTSVLGHLSNVKSLLGQAAKYHSPSETMLERIESTDIELRDIAAELELVSGDINFSQERLTYLEDRLNVIYTLQQKHRVSTLQELVDIRETLSGRLSLINNYDIEIESLNKKLKAVGVDLVQYAMQLRTSRCSVVSKLEEEVVHMLISLGISNANFKVQHTVLDQFTHRGQDSFVFLFSANKKVPPLDLQSVASGGELSRIMLAIKVILSRSKTLPSIIFDEIDSGISGEIAHKMGTIMRQMADNMQVIAITHLPQVASKGDHHFSVYKEEESSSTETKIKLLSKEERITELAKMLSSDEITPAATENAKALLGVYT